MTDDSISRQALLERVGEIWTTNWPLKNAVLNAIHNVPTIDHAKWIPCKERLPQENDRYFVTVKHKGWGIITTDVLRWQGERWGWEEQSICTVLAWMPLPMPWRGEDDERPDAVE